MSRSRNKHKEEWKRKYWRSSGMGKFWKRILAKARRRYSKLELKGIKDKSLSSKESTVNWRND